jgi:nucleotide-binding universal stress UspA family protein
MKRLLVAVDGSDGSNAAVEEALALAADLGAALTFAYVRRPPSLLLGDPFYQHVLTGDFAKACSAVTEAMEAAAAVGIEAESEILEGDPCDEIVSLADNRGADLIVVGSRGYGALAGALLGSVSRAVLQHAHRPVLVAKQAAARERRVA